MATPFFRGNYGSALSRVDTRPIIEAGRARGQMFANMGAQVGGMIKEYGLNKEKRDKAEAAFQGDARRLLQDNPGELEAMKEDPVLGPTLKRIEEGNGTLKDFDKYNAYRAADKEATIEKLELDNAKTQKGMNELNFSLQEALKNPTIKKAVGEANRAEAMGNYANSIVSAEYAAKVEDNRLKAAQTKHQQLLTKALENKEQYTPGQVVDIEGPSGEKVRFYYSGRTLQPLNDGKYIKDINKAIVQGVDSAELEAYIDRTYDVVDGKLEYKESTKFGFGDAPKKNPLMEKAISILALYEVNNEDSVVSNKPTPTTEEPTATQPESVPPSVPTVTTQEEFDALPSGAIYIGPKGRARKP